MRFTNACTGFVLVVATVCGAYAQEGRSKPDPRNLGERLVAVVPMVGKGTAADPIRPLFAPAPDGPKGGSTGTTQETATPAILSWKYEVSSDGRMALLEIVGRDEEALKEIRQSKRADVKVFELGKATKAEIQSEFRRYKPDFDADKFGGGRAPAPGTGGAK